MSSEQTPGMSADRGYDPEGTTSFRTTLRLSATLLLAGQLLYIVITQFHTGGNANDHAAIFSAYADSGIWKAVHVGQFVSTAILVAGLLALFFTTDVRDVTARWAGRFGAASAVVALALYAVLQAVDGVGNKEVDDAWVVAQGAEKTARFASAEAMRWLEWGARSYHDFTLGLALLLFGVALARATPVPRPLAYLVALSGLAYVAQGWVVGAEGFSSTNTILILLAWALSLAWMIWLFVLGRRMRDVEVEGAGIERAHHQSRY